MDRKATEILAGNQFAFAQACHLSRETIFKNILEGLNTIQFSQSQYKEVHVAHGLHKFDRY